MPIAEEVDEVKETILHEDVVTDPELKLAL